MTRSLKLHPGNDCVHDHDDHEREHDHHHTHEHDDDKGHGHEHAHDAGHGHDCCRDDATAPVAPLALRFTSAGGNRVDLKVHGLDCAEEVALLKAELVPLVGDERLAFDVQRGRLLVDIRGTATTAQDVVAAVARTGMRAVPFERDATKATAQTSRATTWTTVASAIAIAAGFGTHAVTAGAAAALTGGDVPWIVRGLYAVAIVLGGLTVGPKALAAVRRLRPDMNLLMTIAVIGAVGIGDWLEAATVAFLFSISLALERWSVGRARRAIESLMQLAPTVARVRRQARFVEVAPVDVAVGEVISVLPGERLALDGVVVDGHSAVNQAPITGESVPVDKRAGSDVFAGTVNGEGPLQIRVTKLAGDTTLAHVARLIEEAQVKRARSEVSIEKFAAIYTPSILALAIVVAAGPPLVAGAAWATWAYNALVLLVIGCPCALVISTPVSIVAGLAAAAREGILIKGGQFLEMPARLKAIAFDKTGTLTLGRPQVCEIVPFDEHDNNALLRIAAAIESKSEHPIARAVMALAKSVDLSFGEAKGFRVERGKGAFAVVDGEEHWLGSHVMLEERGQETPEVHARLEALEADGKTIVVIGNARHVCGFLVLADAVRPSTEAVLGDLRALGIESLVMLTGDNDGTARVVSAQVGVDEYRAELLPAQKVEAVAALVSKYGQVAMVGDGVNDAPAMARSSLGIAMGAAGSDVAVEAADIALMSDDLGKLRFLITHSRRVVSIVRQNVVFALAVKFAFVALALLGSASLWMAIAADMGASLLVTANALRLLKGKKDQHRPEQHPPTQR